MTREEFLAALRRHFGLNEAVNVSDSFEALRSQLEEALNQWPGRPAESLGVLFTFSDRLIAYSWRSESDREAWEIGWQRSEDGFTFGEPTKVERVVRFEPVGESQMQRRGKRIVERIVERVEQTLMLLPVDEARRDGGRPVKAIGITADVVNANGRRYPRSVLAAALADLNSHLHESAGQGRLILTGEAEHPSDKSTGRPNILETVVKWEAATLDAAGQVILEGVILPTVKGKDILVLVENGVPIGVSQRAYGVSELLVENGQTIEEVRELRITGYDFVSEPSDPFARLLEAQQQNDEQRTAQSADGDGEASEDKPDQTKMQEISEQKEPQEQPNMNLEELLKLLHEKPELREALLNKLGLAEKAALAESLGVKPDKLEEAVTQAMAAQQELAQRKHQEAIEAAIREACQDLKYGDEINAEFVEAVRAAKPETPDAVKALVETKRKEYDAITSKAKLATMGKRDVEVKGPVFERETGLPEFTRPALLLTERLVERGKAQMRDFRAAKTPADLFAKRYLEAYDRTYRAQLIHEAQQLQALEEAETTADLQLPYSVQRAIIAEAVPELVALSVFDFGLVDTSPTRLYFENYTPENGAQPVVTDESVTSDAGAWVELDNGRIQPGTVVVTSDPAGTTYDEYDDYLIDYANGRLYTLASGAIGDSTPLLVDYTYDLTRGGELAPIQRGKGQLSFKTIELLADRLAQQISDEAVTFARTQLGWDATARTMAMIIREIREMVDGGVMRLAIAQAHIAGNSGGTWNSASDTVAKLVEKMGTAKVAVQNKYYTPTSYLMSLTNADRLSNWEGYTAAGARLDARQSPGALGPGDTGLRVKGLPVFASTEMPDNKITVQHRELVQYRVLSSKPMSMKGPFPSYDSSGKLMAADQYYVEEYNCTESVIADKGGYVTVT